MIAFLLFISHLPLLSWHHFSLAHELWEPTLFLQLGILPQRLISGSFHQELLHQLVCQRREGCEGVEEFSATLDRGGI